MNPARDSHSAAATAARLVAGLGARVDDVRPAQADALPWMGAVFSAMGRSLVRVTAPRPVSLGFFGTTSAGKSTVVNAVLGAGLLPSDADELSAGLVTFRHGETLRVATAEAPPGFAEVASPCPTLATVRARLQGLLFATRELRAQGEMEGAPLVEVDTDLSTARALLGLGPEVALELIDVPGLRIVEDAVNGSTIGDALARCSPVLVVDVTRLSAFEELGAIARTLGAQGVAHGARLCVVANKIDRLGTEDPTLEIVLGRLRNRIGDAFPAGVEVVATSALLLAGATELATLACASPADLLLGERRAPEALVRRARILLRDGGVAIRRTLPDREARRALDAIESAFEDQSRLDAAQARDLGITLARLAFHAARGEDFCAALRRVVTQQVVQHQTPLPPALKVPLHALARVFQAMIESDGMVEPEEITLATALLADFARGRGVSLTVGEHYGLVPQPQDVDVADALATLERAGLTVAERRLCLGFLLALAAVDKRLCPEERAVLERARAVLRGT